MTDERVYFVCILASGKNGTLYIGVTNDLVRRIWEHKNGVVEGFSKTYDVRHLVRYEMFGHPTGAIKREKLLKHWLRRWKIALIEKNDPDWRDLYDDIVVDPRVSTLTRFARG